MPDEPLVTRRELDLLKAASDIEHAKLWQKLDQMDDHGTRGVLALTVRIDSLIGDVADLKTEVKTDTGQIRHDMDSRFKVHMDVHDKEAKDRRASFRWRIMAGIGAAASMAAVLGLLVEILAKVRLPVPQAYVGEPGGRLAVVIPDPRGPVFALYRPQGHAAAAAHPQPHCPAGGDHPEWRLVRPDFDLEGQAGPAVAAVIVPVDGADESAGPPCPRVQAAAAPGRRWPVGPVYVDAVELCQVRPLPR